jgi:hypothetical protein
MQNYTVFRCETFLQFFESVPCKKEQFFSTLQLFVYRQLCAMYCNCVRLHVMYFVWYMCCVCCVDCDVCDVCVMCVLCVFYVTYVMYVMYITHIFQSFEPRKIMEWLKIASQQPKKREMCRVTATCRKNWQKLQYCLVLKKLHLT